MEDGYTLRTRLLGGHENHPSQNQEDAVIPVQDGGDFAVTIQQLLAKAEEIDMQAAAQAEQRASDASFTALHNQWTTENGLVLRARSSENGNREHLLHLILDQVNTLLRNVPQVCEKANEAEKERLRLLIQEQMSTVLQNVPQPNQEQNQVEKERLQLVILDQVSTVLQNVAQARQGPGVNPPQQGWVVRFGRSFGIRVGEGGNDYDALVNVAVVLFSLLSLLMASKCGSKFISLVSILHMAGLWLALFGACCGPCGQWVRQCGLFITYTGITMLGTTFSLFYLWPKKFNNSVEYCFPPTADPPTSN